MSSTDANIYEQERRGKLQKLRDLGVDPFGQRTPDLQPLSAVKASYTSEMGHDGGPVARVAGRIVFKKDFGKLSFIFVRDDSEKLQVAIDKKRVDELSWKIGEQLDLGDQIVAEGPLGTTRTGEVTVWATKISIASKCLLTPPAKYEGLQDVEQRYRQRYVDLWANPDVMAMAKKRIAIVDAIRSYLKGRGYMEVETPMLQPLHGGAAAKPFVTHHNALDMRLYMRIAPELYLKRLLVGGMPKVFEINRNFRNEGISPRHNPEFTMLEAYEAFGNWETMAELVEDMICTIAQNVFGTTLLQHSSRSGVPKGTINLSRPWRRASMVDLVHEKTGLLFDPNAGFGKESDAQLAVSHEASQTYILGRRYNILLPRLESIYRDVFSATDSSVFSQMARDASEYVATEFVSVTGLPKPSPRDWDSRPVYEEIEKLAPEVRARASAIAEAGLDVVRLEDWDATTTFEATARAILTNYSPAEQLAAIYEKVVEPTLIDPTFVTRVPSVIIPLAKKCVDDPFFADVYELAINGQEISPGYSELNDPDVQAENFRHQVGDKEEQQKVDEDFLTALKYGMPPAGGLGLGIDRLVMMLTGAESIRDVILFPLMKPEG